MYKLYIWTCDLFNVQKIIQCKKREQTVDTLKWLNDIRVWLASIGAASKPVWSDLGVFLIGWKETLILFTFHMQYMFQDLMISWRYFVIRIFRDKKQQQICRYQTKVGDLSNVCLELYLYIVFIAVMMIFLPFLWTLELELEL